MGELSKLYNGVQFIRTHLNHEMQMQQLAILLRVSLFPGITYPELSAALGLTGASVSRNTKALSTYLVKGEKQGLGLVESRPDMAERRRYACFLTKKGEQVLKQLEEAMEA